MVDFPLPPGQLPRVWQPEALAAFRLAAQAKRSRVIASVATGAGKGSIIAAMSILSERKGRPSVIATWRDGLVGDLHARVLAAGGHAGRVQADHNDWSQPIVVASVQTLCRRLDELRRFNPVVLHADEGHHWTSPTSRAVLDAHRWGLVAGWTATPFRSAGKGEIEGLGDTYEACIYEYPITRAIADGVLVPIEARRLLLHVDLSGVDAGDDETIASRFDVDEINATIAADYHDHHAGVPAVYFCANIAHAVHLADALGPRAAAVWGDDPEREAKLADYEAGRLDILCCRDLLTEGWDSPRTTVIGLACPTASVIRYVQTVGRGTRLHPGKTRCYVIDCVGTTETIRYVTWADVSKAEAKAEKKEATRRDMDAKARAEMVGGEVVGQRSYEVFIFGDDAARRLGATWYKYQRSYVAAATRPGTSLRILGVVDRDGPEWAAFVAHTPEGAPPRPYTPWVKGETRTVIDPLEWVGQLGAFPTLDLAAAAVLAHMEESGVRAVATPEEWKHRPATDKMIEGLRKWGVKNREGLTMAESHAMLDAILVTRKVREWQRGVSLLEVPTVAG